MLDSLFRNTLAPWQWAVLAAVPPAILALYFLKLRRHPVEVPSTYLWMRAIEDLHVNSLWQRLRQSLLLFLQLLLVALAILALLRPGWQGTRLDGQRFIFVVDNSASMSATDVGDPDAAAAGDGRGRLAASKEKVAALIDQMERGMSAMLISFTDSPRVVQAFTSNRRLLKERLETIEPTAASTDLTGALRLAGGVANPGRMIVEEDLPGAEVAEPGGVTLYLFTDGRFAEVSDFSLGNLDPVYIPVGSDSSGNLAITAMNVRRNEARPAEKEAFVQVANYTAEPRRVVVDLTLDGEFLDARQAEAPAGGTAGFTFPLADAPAGELEAKIDAPSLKAAGDALALDNNAFAAVNEIDPGAILLVTPGNLVVETALGTGRVGRLGGVEVAGPETLADKERQQRLQAGDYDLVVYDRCAPATADQMPRANTLFIGTLPPTAAWGAAPAAGDGGPTPPPDFVSGPQVIDWNRAHPLLAYVQVGDVLIDQSLVTTPPPGGSTLIDSTGGALLAIAPRESFEDVVLGFPILVEQGGGVAANTDWFKKRSFPTFWLNALDYLVAGRGDPGRRTTAPGATIELRPKGRLNEVTVTGPGGVEQTLTRIAGAPFVFQQTAKRGVYEVATQGRVVQRFAVNLFDAAESDIRLQPTGAEQAASHDLESIRIGYTDVVADSAHSPARKELWRMLLVLAVGVLVFEWYIYNRRVYL
ncbi:MAG: BatA and WFA domain-containing protein [Planctomycetota bacterium]